MAAMCMIAGCPTHTSIADINKDPGHFANKDISISGTVSEAFGALGNGVFQMDDGTGRIWVYSQNYGIPGNGNKVSITGRVQQGFAFNGRNFGVILRQTEDRH
jgi:RecJ-like exonuclease